MERVRAKRSWRPTSLGANKQKTIVAVDERYFRPLDVQSLLGDANKARDRLKWQPKYTVEQLIKEMVTSDLKKALDENNSL